MPSIIEGYNYDIFISYRQKDNKGDRWVSEFVDALLFELEATFKEDISIYFDINPHDGLLETHDVDESLKEKLKCLIFIPIISRTYVDPKAFAWEHEFKAFVRQASEGEFGLKVRLPNGNVASRVLPIQIHDLDMEDVKESESILGGAIRGVEFIYKEPGVNRPLTPNDDIKSNLNKTSYRNQINKVALAIKELVNGIKRINQFKEDPGKKAFELKPQRPQNLKLRKTVLFSLLLIILGVIIYFSVAYISHKRIRNHIYAEIIPQVDSLIDFDNTKDPLGDNYWKAYILLNDAKTKMPDDTNLVLLENRITKAITIHTDPTGASIYGRSYFGSDTSWQYLGITPLLQHKIPFRLNSSIIKIDKEGYQTHIDAFRLDNSFPIDTLYYKLQKESEATEDMMLIAGQYVKPNLNLINNLEPQWIGDFLVDIHEVTNKEYLRFVENGGYRNPVFWKHKFIKDGVQLTWDEAMSFFRDQTGNYGPANWSSGIFPPGKDQHPVSGISWYEAAAYAEYSGKSLPTVYHWSALIDRGLIPYHIKYSNFNNELIAPVGRFKGISRHGLFDVVGNVREWIYNQENNNRFILGGSVKDPTYFSIEAYSTDPLNREEFNGFRCIKYVSDSGRTILERPINYTLIDRSNDKPVSNDEFRLIARRYEYDRTPVTIISSVHERFLEWNKEIVTIAPVYDGPDLEIHIYLPNNVSPPFQSVILFPATNAIREPPTFIDNLPTRTALFLRSGRAIILPKYYNTYGRGNNTNPTPQEYIENCIKRVKDLQRTIDYMELRTDILDTAKIAYFGVSWGSTHSPWILAIEKRIKLGILDAFGLSFDTNTPELYHLNYLPRVTIPMIMFGGRYDFSWSYEEQTLFFENLGTPRDEKKWIGAEAIHAVLLRDIQKEILPWLDQHFGSAINK